MFSMDDLDQPDEQHEQIDDVSNDEAQDDLKDDAAKVAKKIRKPSNRPKLDVERLKGPRGLAVIEKLFSKTKFRGHGYEQEDLKTVMRTLHYWCHRLFPKWTFDDTLAHLERIGTKKPVMTLKKKILYDMLDEEPLIRMDVDQEVEDLEPEDIVPINDFDMLLQTSLPSTSRPTPSAAPPELTQDQKDMITKNRQLAADRRNARLEAQKQKELEISLSSSPTTSLNVTGSLTDEQKTQMEQNRLLAIERRMNRFNPSEDTSAQQPLELNEDSQECVQDSAHFVEKSQQLIQVSQEAIRNSDDYSTPVPQVSQESRVNSEDSVLGSQDSVGVSLESRRHSVDLIQESQDAVQVSQETRLHSEDMQESRDSILDSQEL